MAGVHLGLEGGAAVVVQRRRGGMGAGFDVQVAQRQRLRHALRFRVVLEVRAHHAHRAEHRTLQRHDRAHARHAAHARVGRPGQRMVLHLRDRQSRGDQVAEAHAPPLGIELVDRGAEEELETR